MTHDEMIEAVARAIGDTTDFDGDRMASRAEALRQALAARGLKNVEVE